jgi:hypothetical protein
MRSNVQLRLSASGIDKADDLAAKHEVTRSDVLRACFSVAFRHQAEVEVVLKQLKEQP